MNFDFYLINKILVVLINLIGISLALWVFLSNRQAKINRGFILLVICNLSWINFFNLIYSVSTKETALLLLRLTFASALIFLTAAYYFFIILFLKKKGLYRILGKTILLFIAIISALSLFTNLIITDIVIDGWKIIPLFSFSGKFIFHGIALFLTLFIVGKLLEEYSKFPHNEKGKALYFISGVITFAVTVLIFGAILPFFFKIYTLYNVANYAALFLLGFTAYAIMKRNLFGIKVVLTQMFVVLIALLLLVNFLTSQTEFEYFWKGAILATFCLFGWLLIKSVVREIKQKEQLNQYADDMAKTNAELQDAYGKLEILDKAKSEFVSIASHQLRTPLTAIKGYISMMIEGDYGKISKQALQSMKNVYLANERLVKLVNSLLDMSRLESGKITLEFSPVKVDDLVADILRELRQEAKMKNLKLKMIKDKNELPKIQADPTKLRDALMNLVDNAIKYTNKGGVTVNIKYQIANLKSIIITVADTGEGMTQEEIDKLFQSFSRTDSGRKNWSEGSGLGLYIAKKFIEMHHGNIRAESPGKSQGSRFIVELPISQPN